MVEFLRNLRITAPKLLELTQFASKNLSIYFDVVLCWGPLWSREIFRAQSIYRAVYDFSFKCKYGSWQILAEMDNRILV